MDSDSLVQTPSEKVRSGQFVVTFSVHRIADKGIFPKGNCLVYSSEPASEGSSPDHS